MGYIAGEYDIAVIGAGHAGIEAALAGAKLGLHVALFTLNLDALANLPCNPCIGGSAKGHLVREIDALGGFIAKASDETFIQSRMLNSGRGPAIHSPRCQIDRRMYQTYAKSFLEKQENLDLKQAEIVRVNVKDGKVSSVVTRLDEIYNVNAAIVCSGTYLRGKIIIGDKSYSGGPDGLFAANELSEALREIGVNLRRFKTGTPARVNRRSLDFSKMEIQEGDSFIVPMSFSNADRQSEFKNRVVCHLTYTNTKTHDIIRANLHRSPLYSGMIEGVGPRYCPSIEDKVVRFKDKDRHQLFIEPMGLQTDEMYIQGMSSSLPTDVQSAMYATVGGLENVSIMRPAYAIEYDCCDPLQLYPTLEFKEIAGLYGAGQFNGTSGYEEAAAQGLVAGINAALKLLNREPVILERSGSYIGTLIDDLVTKGTNEPYRMMTSRSEYRLLLRQDNADERLMPIGYDIGLITEEEYDRYLSKKEAIRGEIERLHCVIVPPSEKVNAYLNESETAPLHSGIRMDELLRRPQLTYDGLAFADPERPLLPWYVKEEVEIKIKYEGYIRRQLSEVAQNAKLERRLLPEDIEYNAIGGLRIEARQKLSQIKPKTLGQASRISGVNPADISVLLIYLMQRKGGNDVE
ncbi:MAG: tRNA uridine-5-carboxymethylaminomethyl(34) synthesis enzyme MnmG [Bacillota bacterium]|nr:tRNA uridine-5-carboxymethylaminomethyl(34) synthesis enzyme MnmG [Bacillota bacterium]